MAARRTTRKKKPTRKRKPRRAAVAPPKTVSAAGLAREFDCARNAVHKAIATGRLDGTWTKNSRGHYEIELEKARAAWKEEASQDTVLGSPPGPDLGSIDDGSILDRKAAQQVLHHFKAMEAQRLYLIAVGRLTDGRQTELGGAEIAKSMRTHIQGLADQHAEDLATEDDPVETRRILKDILNSALNKVCDDLEKFIHRHVDRSRAAS